MLVPREVTSLFETAQLSPSARAFLQLACEASDFIQNPSCVVRSCDILAPARKRSEAREREPRATAHITTMMRVTPARNRTTSKMTTRRSARVLRSVAPRRAPARSATRMMTTPSPKKILMLGGTRFIGVYLARMLVDQGHEVTLMTRGKSPIAVQIPDDTDEYFASYESAINHIAVDRKDADAVESKLKGTDFDVVYDINAREKEDILPILSSLPNLDQYVLCSSAGVYLKSDEMPHCEVDATDPKSRHKGKLNMEDHLEASGVNYCSIRPVYIYGPLNYNPVEEWFFHRIAAGRPIPVPGNGKQITQLGHVKDLAVAFTKVLDNPKAKNQIYNISGERVVTFDGIAKACAMAAGAPEPELVHFDANDFDFGGKKAFPMRDQHFFTSIEKAMADLAWKPEYDLVGGLTDSYEKDFGRGTFRKPADFSVDDVILEKLKVMA